MIGSESSEKPQFAIQLAAWKGAFVWTTVSEANVEFVRELGASGIIDHRKTKFEEVVKDADVVLDLVGGDTLRRSFGAILYHQLCALRDGDESGPVDPLPGDARPRRRWSPTLQPKHPA